jgi:hypothetical protein
VLFLGRIIKSSVIIGLIRSVICGLVVNGIHMLIMHGLTIIIRVGSFWLGLAHSAGIGRTGIMLDEQNGNWWNTEHVRPFKNRRYHCKDV